MNEASMKRLHTMILTIWHSGKGKAIKKVNRLVVARGSGRERWIGRAQGIFASETILFDTAHRCHYQWVKSLSHVRLFATPWTIAHQGPSSMEFSRQEYWSGLRNPICHHTFSKPIDNTMQRVNLNVNCGLWVTWYVNGGSSFVTRVPLWWGMLILWEAVPVWGWGWRYWVGQKNCSGFPMRCSGKTQMNFWAKPIYGKSLLPLFSFTVILKPL